MMRTTPDERRAAAARAELQRRVRAAAGRPDGTAVARSPRPRRPWVLQAAGGAAAVLVMAGLALGAERLVPAPRSPAASTAAPSAGVRTSATATPAQPLLGLEGARLRSDAELRAEARRDAAPTVDPVVLGDQRVIEVHCMAQHGWLYDPERQLQVGLSAHPGLTDAQWTAFQDALEGAPTTGPYDWRTAGCSGLAVHETGQDGKD